MSTHSTSYVVPATPAASRWMFGPPDDRQHLELTVVAEPPVLIGFDEGT